MANPRKARFDPEEMDRLRERLEARRKELYELRTHLNEAWVDINQPYIEVEENAQKLKSIQGVEQLDTQEKNEIEAIDDAIRRMAAGSYGICASCGGFISRRRLEAIPWTDLCGRCVRLAEARLAEEPAAPPRDERFHNAPLPEDFDGMPDEDICNSILDTLTTDGRVEMQELEIDCREGVVHLEGYLPSEEERQILLEILEDTLGLPDVIDEIRIEPVLWERADRDRPPEELARKTGEEELLQGEDVEIDSDAYESSKSGLPMEPPDRLIPEKEK